MHHPTRSPSTLTRLPLPAASWLALGLVSSPASAAHELHAGDRVQLRSAHGTYLVAEPNLQLNANRAVAGANETFTVLDPYGSAHGGVLHYGHEISIRSAHNSYLVAEPHGSAHANRPAAGAWERWRIVDPQHPGNHGVVHQGDCLALQSTAFSKYLVAEPDGRAEANRDHPGAWETFCTTPPAVDVEHGRFLLQPDSVFPIVVQTDPANVSMIGDDYQLEGTVTIETRHGGRIELLEASLTLEYAADPSQGVERLIGHAQVPFPELGVFSDCDVQNPAMATVGLDWGHELGDLDAPLAEDRRYFVFSYSTGLEITCGPLTFATPNGQSTTIALDPWDPSVFFRGNLPGMPALGPLEDMGIGVSVNGWIPWEPSYTWGIEDHAEDIAGHVYLEGSVNARRPPVTLSGSMVLDLDVDDDGTSLLQSGNEFQLGVNGDLTLGRDIAPGVSFELPIGGASANLRFVGDAASGYFSGNWGLIRRTSFRPRSRSTFTGASGLPDISTNIRKTWTCAWTGT